MDKNRYYYTVAEAAELLRVTPRTVKRWLTSGELDSRKIGGRRLVIIGPDLRPPTPEAENDGD